MRLVHLIDSLAYGGAQRLLVTFAEEVRRRGWPLSVATLDGNPERPLARELEALGVPISYFPARRLRNPKRLAALTTFLRRERADLVHTHLYSSNILGALTARPLRIPVVSTLHSTRVSLVHPRRSGLKLETMALRHAANRVIAVGQAVADANRERLGDRPIDVIPNAVALIPTLSDADRQRARLELVGDSERPLIITVGRLEPPKGFGDLLTAFASVHDVNPAAALVIVGDGSQRDDVMRQITELDLTGHAFVTGWRGDAPRLLAAADLYVCSSHWEGLPVSLLEAMSAGLPIVATGVGDIPLVLSHDTGMVVPPHEPRILGQAILSLLSDTDTMRAMGARAREEIVRHYAPRVWADRLYAVYDEVLAGLRVGAEVR